MGNGGSESIAVARVIPCGPYTIMQECAPNLSLFGVSGFLKGYGVFTGLI